MRVGSGRFSPTCGEESDTTLSFMVIHRSVSIKSQQHNVSDAMTVDIEQHPQQGKKEHAGSSPETVRVYTQTANGTQYVTHLSRWDDGPLSVDKRVKKTGSGTNRTTKRVTPKVTPKVREAIESRGYEIK